MTERLNIEEYPLRSANQSYEKKPLKTLKGPLRVVRLCLLGIILPTILLALPLYMRYRVYGHQFYPLAMSDMRMLDNKVSTTWCQRQLVRANTTFNAFLLPQTPQLATNLKPLSMIRHLVLEDDTKEYWGFYLLRGSSVTVSTCVRWPGASLIVIRGHKHLQECAYIGDDSSEELEELEEAIREGVYVPKSETGYGFEKVEQPANEPELMKRHRPDIEFHSPIHKNSTKNHTLTDDIDVSDVTDPKTMREILDTIRSKKVKSAKSVNHQKRNSTIAKDESGNFDIKPPQPQDITSSKEILQEILHRLDNMGERAPEILQRINDKYKKNSTVRDTVGRHYSKPKIEFNEYIDKSRRRRDLVDMLSNLEDEETDKGIEEELEDLERKKRDILLSTYVDLNKHDEENDNALEEGFSPSPDGIADIRGKINETTDNDMSNSEFWSSFSSSEEALLNCAGLILNLPLTPHHKCSAELSDDEAEETYLANSVTYKVPVNGYYFFVFNSENEIQPNYIRVQFHLNKAVYDVSNPVAYCKNTSESCALDLRFFSSEKLVMELPVNENDTLWNEEFIVVSECEPRTAIYVVCVITVPVLVMLFAFS